MPYVNTKKIDGLDIVYGFEPPEIDPLETQKIAMKEFESSELFAKFQSILSDILKYETEIHKLEYHGKDASVKRDKVKPIYKKRDDTHEKLNSLYGEIYNKNIVRFGQVGTFEVTCEISDVLKTKFSELLQGELLTYDGVVLTDNRGKEIFYKDDDEWVQMYVTKLTDDMPKQSKFLHQLTEHEKREIMMQPVPGNTEVTKEQAIEKAIKDAALMKIGYEIDGELDPAEKAKEWLDAKKAEIEKHYAK
jgi:hypothetical protein